MCFVCTFLSSAILNQNEHNKGKEVRNIQTEHVNIFFILRYFFFVYSNVIPFHISRFFFFERRTRHSHTNNTNHLLHIELCQFNSARFFFLLKIQTIRARKIPRLRISEAKECMFALWAFFSLCIKSVENTINYVHLASASKRLLASD